MIVSKIVSVIFVGLLLSIGLWIACYILMIKMYPKYRLQLRHHIFSLLIVVATFILYCSFSTISATIEGIENTLNSVKTIVLEKNNLVDDFTAILSSASNNDQQAFVSETNKSISEILETNSEFNDYIGYIDFSQIDTQGIAKILNIDNLPVKEKSLQITNLLFRTYVNEFTGTLKRIWWTLLIVIIVVQLLYFSTMIYRAECKTRRNNLKKTRLYEKTPKNYSRNRFRR